MQQPDDSIDEQLHSGATLSRSAKPGVPSIEISSPDEFPASSLTAAQSGDDFVEQLRDQKKPLVKKLGKSLAGHIGSSLIGQLDGAQDGESLSGQLGSSLIGQLGGGQVGGSTAGQLGSSLIGQLGGGQGEGSIAEQLGSSLIGQLGVGQGDVQDDLIQKLQDKKKYSAKKLGKSIAGHIGSSLVGQLTGGQGDGGSIAGQLGSSLIGQLGGGQGGGSIARQFGSSLIGQLGGGGGQLDRSVTGQFGGSLMGQLGGGGSAFAQLGGAGGMGGGQPGGGRLVAGQPVQNPIMGTVACSAVQGIRRAVEAKSTPMKIFWILMVLVSVVMFVKGTMTFTEQLSELRVEKSFQMDKVPFVFPDLYFCPSNSYSGSFPYTLDQSQAELINKEVERLSQLFDLQQPTSGLDSSSRTRVWLIQQSMPVHLLKEYIMHRPEQSMFYPPLITNVGAADFEVVFLPGNRICFKILLAEEDRGYLRKRRNRENLRLALFTDPTFSDFKYAGHQIKPIINSFTNESIPFRVWYPSGIVNMMGSGYTMLIVPRGVYPSMEHEMRIKLAPGKSYDIDIQMEENRFSDELWGKHCSPDHENAAFVDHLTGQRVDYNYSYDACYFTEFAKSLHKVAGYVQQGYPVAWDLRGSPRWGNLTENLRINRSTEQYAEDMSKAYEMNDPNKLCRRLQPCVQNKYTASFSFHSWPSLGGSYSTAFKNSDPVQRPAIAHLARIARDLDTGKHSTHSEAVFRYFLSESMLEVRIRAESPLSPRVLMTASYSSTAYLSDIGGLMGLYLGCSVLTLCELMELVYTKAREKIKFRCGKRQNSVAKSGDVESGENVEEPTSDDDDETTRPLEAIPESNVAAGKYSKSVA